MLTGKNALVTGSSSGIGLGIARALTSRGVNLVMHGIEPAEEVETKRTELEAETGIKVLYRQADMTQPEQIRALVEFARSELGPVDILLNNAGIQFVSPVEEFPEDKWDAVIAINLSAAFHTIKAVLPAMKSRGFGRIINIASVHGLVASPYKSAYVAAKHGIVGMTRAVAIEAAEYGVTVNAICPGYVWTPLLEQQVPNTARSRGISEQEVIDNILLQAQPTRQFITIEQVAELACFLCTDAAASITGSAQVIDGGWTAQ